MLYNILSRPLSFLDWTTAMLFWLDFHHPQSNLYKWFRIQLHDWSSMNPKGPMSHLSLSPCTGSRFKFKKLMLAYRTATGSAPTYFHPLLRIYIPSRSLRSTRWATSCGTSTERHKITFQNFFIHRSWLVEWTSHPYPECWIPDNFQATPENSSLSSPFDKKNAFSFLNLSLSSLY